MMKWINCVSLVSILLFGSSACDRLGLCQDESFSFPLSENQSGRLRLDGYYYLESPIEPSNFDSTQAIFLLYKNGILYENLMLYDAQKVERGDIDLQISTNRRSSKGFWGIYHIEGDSLEYQVWLPSPNGCKEVGVVRGHILSDTAFVLSSSFRLAEGEEMEFDPVHSYRFRAYNSKPDSMTEFMENF